MGLIQSMFCAVSFCIERVLTWVCCAFTLVMFLFTLILLMVYGISLGYHYAQKELVSFALYSRTSTSRPEDDWLRAGRQLRPRQVLKLKSMNRTEYEKEQLPEPHEYTSNVDSGTTFFVDITSSPTSLLSTTLKRTTPEPELSAEIFNSPKKEPGRPLRIYERPEVVWHAPPQTPQRESELSAQSFNRPPEQTELQDPTLFRSPTEPELTPQERDLARRLIGRYRRAKSYTQDTTVNAYSPFMKFIRNATDIRFYLPNVI